MSLARLHVMNHAVRSMLWAGILTLGLMAWAQNQFRLTSPAFGDGQPIPKQYTADGPGESPPLRWSGMPAGTQQMVLVVDDPDAAKHTDGKAYVHWVIYGLAPDLSGLPQGVPSAQQIIAPVAADQGLNSRRQMGYTPPAPPAHDPPHHYHFRLFALNQPVPMQPGMDASQVLTAIRGHVLAEADLTGVYGRTGEKG
jgi:Raf kinase inhibitor-like YbhB/YbcL family protein